MDNRKSLLVILCFPLLIVLAGCWDQTNIEEHGFVIGTAVDFADDDTGEKTLAMTNQIVSPGDLGTPENGSSDQPPYINLTTTGKSLFDISRNMLKEISRAPYYEHLRFVIVSEEVARDPEVFASIMDVFIRNRQMRRGIKVVIAEGEAKNILEINPKPEKLPVMYVDMITDNAYAAMDMIEPVRLGKLHSYLLNESSYVLPRIRVHEDHVDYNKVVVFNGKKDQMVGDLNDLETIGMHLIKGDMNGGIIKFKLENHTMVFEIERLKSGIKIDPQHPEDMDISVNIKTEGNLAEMYGSKTLLEPSYLADIEEEVGKQIEDYANRAINKAQQDYELDVLGIDETLKVKHPKIWKKVKSNWENGENYFASSRIHVSVDVNIRETGATDRAKDKRQEYQ